MSVPPVSGAPEWDAGATLAQRFRAHADGAQHFYGYAIRGMADEWEAGGPARRVLGGYENAPRGAVIDLRLLAGVFRLVLTGRAPELVPFYPCLGGTAPASEAWPVMRHVIGKHIEELHAALAVPPQTNEVGRSVALLVGLFDLVAACGVRRIRLLEVGASAGLNLLLDHCAYRGESWQFGTADSKVQFLDPIEGRVRPEPVDKHWMLGEVSMEFQPQAKRGTKPELRTRLWNPAWGRSVQEHLIGTAHDHGVPVITKSWR